MLVDGIKDKTGTQAYEQEITLPNVECDKCTLQVIQVMTDKPPYGDGDDIYFQCADIVLSNSATGDEGDAGSSSGDAPTTSRPAATDGACRSSGSQIGSSTTILLALAVASGAAYRRRTLRRCRPP